MEFPGREQARIIKYILFRVPAAEEETQKNKWENEKSRQENRKVSCDSVNVALWRSAQVEEEVDEGRAKSPHLKVAYSKGMV